ncbi:MAG: hypothetical protein DME19_06300 [Verrucomicrobia bacterium]|nr:MAG: hypothetical protein DME19_06300 [Verrucomicrobiota bacterium]
MAHSSEQIISEIEEILGRPTVRLVETLREETRRAISNIDATSAEITLYATIAHPCNRFARTDSARETS